MKRAIVLFCAAILFFPLAGFLPAKGKNPFKGYQKEANGTYFKIIEKGSGTIKADSGYVLFIRMKFLTENDSVFLNLNESTQNPSFPFMVEKPRYKGDFIDMFIKLNTGDSAKFFVSLDSIHKYYPNEFVLDSAYNSMKYLGFALRVDSIYSPAQVTAMRIKMKADQQKQVKVNDMMQLIQSNATERIPGLLKKDSALFVAQVNMYRQAVADPNGCYYIEMISGTGKPVEIGKKVTIRYTGTFLDGTIFDSNQLIDGQPPMVLVLDKNTFIPGFTAGILKMKAGGKSRFILTSPMAYNDGLSRIFEVEIVSVE